MLNIIFSLLLPFLPFTSIHTFSFTDIDGNTVNMAAFEGKKILLVNTASGSEFVSQYAELEQLHQQYQDSLVIIVFPSNDFGNEPGTSTAIKDTIRNTYNAHYIIAAKSAVKSGEGLTPISIYQWLYNEEQNGSIHIGPDNDFYKYLIGVDGYPIGVFKSTVSPLSDEMKMALNYERSQVTEKIKMPAEYKRN